MIRPIDYVKTTLRYLGTGTGTHRFLTLFKEVMGWREYFGLTSEGQSRLLGRIKIADNLDIWSKCPVTLATALNQVQGIFEHPDTLLVRVQKLVPTLFELLGDLSRSYLNFVDKPGYFLPLAGTVSDISLDLKNFLSATVFYKSNKEAVPREEKISRMIKIAKSVVCFVVYGVDFMKLAKGVLLLSVRNLRILSSLAFVLCLLNDLYKEYMTHKLNRESDAEALSRA